MPASARTGKDGIEAPPSTGTAASGRRGISLIEVLIASTVISLAVIPLWSLQYGQQKQTSHTQHTIMLAGFAEETAARHVCRLISSRFTLPPGELEKGELPSSAVGGGMEGEYTVFLEKVEGAEGLWKIEVSLEWRAAGKSGIRGGKLETARLVSDPAALFKGLERGDAAQ